MKLAPPILLAAATLALAACAGSSDDGTGDGAAAGKPSEDDQLAFARCMRAEGIDFPDPGPAGSGPREMRIGRGVAPGKLEEATERCSERTGGGPRPLSQEEQAEFRDAALKFARCMRSKGIDIPDPEVRTGKGGAGILVKPGGGDGPDPRSAAFRRAEEECRRFLPGRPGTRGGGGAVAAPAS